jgi:hypothetical protein
MGSPSTNNYHNKTLPTNLLPHPQIPRSKYFSSDNASPSPPPPLHPECAILRSPPNLLTPYRRPIHDIPSLRFLRLYNHPRHRRRELGRLPRVRRRLHVRRRVQHACVRAAVLCQLDAVRDAAECDGDGDCVPDWRWV